MIEPTREELIQICRDAVVHHSKWRDRDSFMAQQSVQSVYEGLTGGMAFTVIEEEEVYWITFEPGGKRGEHLEISTREDYIRDCDPGMETEMFEGGGIDFDSGYLTSYIPTRKRLDEVNGEDWY